MLRFTKIGLICLSIVVFSVAIFLLLASTRKGYITAVSQFTSITLNQENLLNFIKNFQINKNYLFVFVRIHSQLPEGKMKISQSIPETETITGGCNWQNYFFGKLLYLDLRLSPLLTNSSESNLISNRLLGYCLSQTAKSTSPISPEEASAQIKAIQSYLSSPANQIINLK